MIFQGLGTSLIGIFQKRKLGISNVQEILKKVEETREENK